MDLQTRIENAGATVEYILEEGTEINFLFHVDTYDRFKSILSVLETYVTDNSFQSIGGVSYSGQLLKGGIFK